jgi:hypothetical protein
MPKYHLIKSGVVENTVEWAAAPPAETYPGYTVIEATNGGPGWTWDGTTLSSPASPPSPVPERITNAQARYILRRTPTATAGVTLFDAVDAAAKAQGGDLLDFWEYANDLYRSSPAVLTLAGALGITTQQLDDLFRAAGGVQI